MSTGNAYVNLHTNDGVGARQHGRGDFPGGEIRADIRCALAEGAPRRSTGRLRPPRTPGRGDWYEIGITVGLGVAAGLLLAGLLAGWRYGPHLGRGALAVGVLALLVKGWIGLPGALVGALVGAVSASVIARGALAAARRPAARLHRGERLDRGGAARRSPSSATCSPWPCPPSRPAGRGKSLTDTPGSARSPSDAAQARPRRHRRPHADHARGSLGDSSTPTLTALADRGTLGRATTTFPSLTPVCLSSIATGAHPRRPRDPPPRVVAPRRAPARRVRPRSGRREPPGWDGPP